MTDSLPADPSGLCGHGLTVCTGVTDTERLALGVELEDSVEESVSFISQARLLLGVGVASLQTLVVFRLINLEFFFFSQAETKARLEQTVQLLWSVDSNLGRLESDR